MIPSLEGLQNLDQEAPENRFGLLNFHRDEQLESALSELLEGGDPSVLVLTGERGIGRGYFCEAVAHRARERGAETQVWHLDLDGFEPEVDRPLVRYLTYLLERSGRLESRGEALGRAADLLNRAELEVARGDRRYVEGGSEWMAAVLSLLSQFDVLADRFAAFTRQPSFEPWTLDAGGRDLLDQLLAEVVREQRLILHVRDPLQLTGPLRAGLIQYAEADPKLLLALACSYQREADRLASEATAPLQLGLTALSVEEGVDQLARRFIPGTSAKWLKAASEASRGRPAALAAIASAGLASGSIRSDAEGRWKLSTAAEAEPPEEVILRGLWSEIHERLEEEGEVGKAVREWLSRAALCGTHIPAAPILEHLAVNEEVGEEALDFIDDVLVETYGWLVDLEFHHPAFRLAGVYNFSHPILRSLLLDELSEIEREMQAISLLRFLEQKLPPTTRGTSRLLLALAELLDEKHRRFYEAQLSWWAGKGSFDALGEQVREGIQKGQVDPDLVWKVVASMRQGSPERRLTLLDAYGRTQFVDQEKVLPFDAMAQLHLLRAELLMAVRRPDDAIQEAERARSFIEDNPYTLARSWHLTGAAHLQEERVEPAVEAFEKASDFLNGELGAQHPETLAVQFHLAIAYRAADQHEASIDLQEQILETRMRVLGEHHPETVNTTANLAMTLRSAGESRASDLEESLLDSARLRYGEEDPRIANLMAQLALGLKSLDLLDRAADFERQVLDIKQNALGDKHPETMAAMANLAVTLARKEEFKEAIHFEVEVMEARKRTFGEGHPATLAAISRLASTLQAKGDVEGAAELERSVQEGRVHLFGHESASQEPSILRA